MVRQGEWQNFSRFFQSGMYRSRTSRLARPPQKSSKPATAVPTSLPESPVSAPNSNSPHARSNPGHSIKSGKLPFSPCKKRIAAYNIKQGGHFSITMKFPIRIINTDIGFVPSCPCIICENRFQLFFPSFPISFHNLRLFAETVSCYITARAAD